MIKKIKDRLKTTSIYRNYDNRRKLKELYRKNKLLYTYGDDALRILFKVICGDCNKSLWLEYGTLLGAYRDKDYIKHDFDIDLGMYREDFTNELVIKLENAGVGIKRIFYIERPETCERELSEVTLICNGLLVDLFLSTKVGENRISYVCVNPTYKHSNFESYSVKEWKVYDAGVVKYQFKGIEVMVPVNPEVYLRSIYGDDFMTPVVYFGPIHELNPHATYYTIDRLRAVLIGSW